MSLRDSVYKYISEKYNDEPEYLWVKFPEYAVFRNKDNNKWYSIVMNVKKLALGLSLDENLYIDVINVKCPPLLIDILLQQKGYISAYHMNKNNWITVLLDGTVELDDIFKMIDMSYDVVGSKQKRKN